MFTDMAVHDLTFPVLDDTGRSESEHRGYIHGHSAGYTAGLREAAAKVRMEQERQDQRRKAEREQEKIRLQQALEALGAAAESFETSHRPALRDLQYLLVERALELAESIVGYELRDRERGAHAALQRALSLQPESDVHTVRMNPDDLRILEGQTDAVSGVKLEADPALLPGDAVADCLHGYVDAKIGTALDRARAALAAVEL